MIKFLHAADLHLDAPFSALRPELAAQRRREQLEVLTALFDAAQAHGCDLVLLAGDLFDAENAGAETVEALQRACALCRAKIFIAPGNHDCCRLGSSYRMGGWPGNVHIFRSRTIERVCLPELSCTVFGAGFEASFEQALLEGFRAEDDGAQIMVLHGDAVQKDSSYNPISKAQIESSNLTYLALGHIHQASGLLHAGKTAYAWPGCAMGRGFDELGEKGAYLGEISDSGEVTLRFLPLGGRKYEILRVEAGSDPLAAIRKALPAQTQNDIYRILLTGEAEEIDTQALERELEGQFFGLSIRDETRPKKDLWQGAGENTLRGLYLTKLRAQYDAAPDEQTRRAIAQAARLGLDAMENRLEVEV